MGHKVVPTSLRIGLNQNFDSSYFHDIYYSDILAKDLSLQSYFQSLLSGSKISKGRIFSNFSFKKQSVHIFAFPTRSERFIGRPMRGQKNLSFLKKRKNFKKQNVKPFRWEPTLSKSSNNIDSLTSMRLSNNSSVPELRSTKPSQIHFSEIKTPQTLLLQKYQNLFQREKNIHHLQKLSLSSLSQFSQMERFFFFLFQSFQYLSPKDLFFVALLFIQQKNEKLLLNSIDFVKQSNGSNTPNFNPSQIGIDDLNKNIYKKSILQKFTTFQMTLQKSSPSFEIFKKSSFHKVSKMRGAKLLTTLRNMRRKELPTTFSTDPWASVQRFPSMEAQVAPFVSTPTSIRPFKMSNIGASAHFVARFLVRQLETKQPFRRSMKKIIAQVKKSPKIKGIRLVCAGRLGGAEMARVETRKWGATSLHVFSSHIDYSAQTASTAHGLIGVKVWICYFPD